MMYELSHEIESDLEEIGDYIARHNPRRALTFVRELQAMFQIIAANPLGYRLRPDLSHDTRIASMGKYLIVFLILHDLVRIDRVLSGYRDLRSKL